MIAQQLSEKLPGNCLAKRCNRDGCSISMEGISSSKILIDIDSKGLPDKVMKILKTGKRCDYIFIGKMNSQTREWVIPLELKKGGVHVGGVVAQLQTGADVAHILVPRDQDISFQAVVASGRISKIERRELQRRSVSFRGTKKIIYRLKCGSKLIEVPHK